MLVGSRRECWNERSDWRKRWENVTGNAEGDRAREWRIDGR